MATKKTTTKKTTVKKAATKKTVAKKAAVKKTVTKKTPAKKATRKASAKNIAKKTTTIVAKCDIGFGNMLFIRGEGAGLGWEAGIPMENIDSETWKWSAEADSTVEAKVLINDDNWAAGSNTVVEPGETVSIEPSFG